VLDEIRPKNDLFSALFPGVKNILAVLNNRKIPLGMGPQYSRRTHRFSYTSRITLWRSLGGELFSAAPGRIAGENGSQAPFRLHLYLYGCHDHPHEHASQPLECDAWICGESLVDGHSL